jgi:CheY-like chemotaxis protein/two-component sensor histidine kinase
LERLLNLGATSRVQSELASMNEVINETYEDVRGAIMGLRTLIKPGPDLLFNLEEALRRFGLEHNIETQMIVADGYLSSLSLEVQIQLIRVIQECLSNVAKHANASKVSLKLEELEKGIGVVIEDDGSGFDPTRLTGPSWRHMGFRTSRERIESVGGSFQIEARLGRGTKVIVRLPTQREMKPLRIMLVDDQVLFREGMVSLLETTPEKIQVVGEAENGLEATEKAKQLRPDLILMDIGMPRCDGLEATRQIKNQVPDVKIVMLTVSDHDSDLFEAIKAGAQGYLLKNLSAAQLFEMLARMLEQAAPPALN